MPTSKQRRAAERRRLRRQAQRRQQHLQHRRRINIIVSIVGTLLIIGFVVTLIAVTNGSSPSAAAKKSSTKTASASASSSAATTSATCSYPKSGTAARKVATPATTASKVGTVTVRVTTSRGAMTFRLNRASAPCTVNSFVSLAKQKYFNATTCHRLVTKSIYVLQCGDPTAKGTGGPGYKFNDELTGKEKYTRGVLAMANSGANTNGSQFFIVDKNSTLSASYTVFGTVTAGLGVVDKVYKAGTANGSTDGTPKLTLRLTKVSVG